MPDLELFVGPCASMLFHEATYGNEMDYQSR